MSEEAQEKLENSDKNVKQEIWLKYKSTFFAVDKFIDKFNEQYPDGRDPNRLKSQSRALAHLLIKEYGRQLAKNNQYLCPAGEEENTKEYAPDLSTNSEKLSKRLGCSPRTVRTHIKKLYEAGFIVNKRLHGPRANYDIRINSKLIQVKKIANSESLEREILEILKLDSPNGIQAFKGEAWQNLPPEETTRNTSNKTNTSTIVEKGSSANAEQGEKATDGNNHGNRRVVKNLNGPDNSHLISKNRQMETKGAAASDHFHPLASPELRNYIAKMALQLWLMAYKHIWSDWEFNDSTLKECRQMLIPYFKKCSSKEKADEAYLEYSWRIEKAGGYMSRNEGFNRLHPFKYFDPSFKKNGFYGTKNWYIAYRKQHRYRLRKSYVDQAIQQILQQPSLALMQKHRQRITSWTNHEALLREFDHSLSNIYHEFQR